MPKVKRCSIDGCNKRAWWIYDGKEYCSRHRRELPRYVDVEQIKKPKRPKRRTLHQKGVSLHAERTMSERVCQLRKRATPAEKEFRRKLKVASIPHKFQRAFIKYGYSIADFYFARYKTVIEIDGGYHNNPTQKAKDEKRDKRMWNIYKTRTIRITNEEAYKITPKQIKTLLAVWKIYN